MRVETYDTVCGLEWPQHVGEAVGSGWYGEWVARTAGVAAELHCGWGGNVGVDIVAEFDIHDVSAGEPGYDEEAEGGVACFFVGEVAKDFRELGCCVR